MEQDNKYNHRDIEAKWQKVWKRENSRTKETNCEKKYILDMFPYPSGAGLHIGHVESYTATDIVMRYLVMKGYNVLRPQGWDAFGLPAENYAIQTGIHPKQTTDKAIANFKRQIEMMGFAYDWSREVNTSDQEYYRWTQWIFLQLYNKGLAYKKTAPVNWCENDKTVLANEQVVDGKCERCGNLVIQKNLEQWFFKVTAYAEELLNGIDELDWPDALKHAQRNWIGRSEGALIKFEIRNSKFETNSKSKIQNSKQAVEVFTTRPDTLFGATYLVVAPEHPFVTNNKSRITNWKEVEKYINNAKTKNKLERTDLAKEKTGVELKGVKAINPATKEEIPVWAADYVLTDYGTGAIMAVPAHDNRDFEFARKFKLPIIEVIAPYYKNTDGIDKIRPGKKTVKRTTVYCIVKHWKENKILCLKWKFNNWQSFIIGGCEDKENIIDAGIREIKEETGFKNIRFVKRVEGEVHTEFYAIHKDENRYSIGYGLYFELENDDKNEVPSKELEKHEPVWVDEEKVADFLSFENLKYVWRRLMSGNKCYSGEGIVINSGKFSGLTSEEAKDKITKFVKGKKQIQYKIRDWLISRQRYWGAPIPIVYDPQGKAHPVKEEHLPLILPNDVDFKPTGTSPLGQSNEYKKRAEKLYGQGWHFEADTMDTFVCSSWYYLRYTDPRNEKEFAAKEKLKYWLPVDLYIGGMEHAVGHFIYARFMTKALRDLGYLDFSEPFLKIRNQGIILAEDGRKMSKRWGNVINPDDVVKEYGADALRMYEMFMGPLEDMKPWNSRGIVGVRRFLDKIYSLNTKSEIRNTAPEAHPPMEEKQIRNSNDQNSKQVLEKQLNLTIKKVTDDIENIKLNTAISAMMIFVNEIGNGNAIIKDQWKKFLIILAPFAPHLAEELWEKLGHKQSIFKEKWPKADEKLLKQLEVEIVIQVNGKVRDKVKMPQQATEAQITAFAEKSAPVKKYTAGKQMVKKIYVPGKLLNIVVK